MSARDHLYPECISFLADELIPTELYKIKINTCGKRFMDLVTVVRYLCIICATASHVMCEGTQANVAMGRGVACMKMGKSTLASGCDGNDNLGSGLGMLGNLV